MSEEELRKEAIEAIANGQRQRARDILVRLLRADQSNPEYWLWMSSLVDTPKERRYCLKRVLQLDPGNKIAQRGLLSIEGLPPPQDLKPPPVVRTGQPAIALAKSMMKRLFSYFSQASWRTRGFFGAGFLLFGLLLLGIIGPPNRSGGRAVRPAIAPSLSTPRPTATLLPTNTPWHLTPTPTFVGPVPLWMQLEATYTPTPVYVETPHPISEAYRAGLRALHAGDLPSMLLFMQQAADIEPQAADTHYYVGEAYRLMGEFEKALEAYDRAVNTNPGFAPAYLGRARANSQINPQIEPAEDLSKALDFDPLLAEAYLERAVNFLDQGDLDAARHDLELYGELKPSSPLLFLYLAQLHLEAGDYEAALQNAQLAHELDLTLLPAYLTLGRANIAMGDAGEAIELLETYLLFEKKDAPAWGLLGRALYESGKLGEALERLNKAIELDEELADAYFYRGHTFLEMGEGQSAVNDFFEARRLNPESFAASLGMGRALWLAGRTSDAIRQITGSQDLAGTDEDLAQIYYWRATIYAGAGNLTAAIKDWEALLALPEEAVPADWATAVRASLLALTPSPAPATPSPTPAL